MCTISVPSLAILLSVVLVLTCGQTDRITEAGTRHVARLRRLGWQPNFWGCNSYWYSRVTVPSFSQWGKTMLLVERAEFFCL